MDSWTPMPESLENTRVSGVQREKSRWTDDGHKVDTMRKGDF
jgi:hypothetical protein